MIPLEPSFNDPSSFIVVCTVDGSVQIIHAWKGKLHSIIPLGPPLVAPSEWIRTADESTRRRMVPNLDGELYLADESTQELTHLKALNMLDLLQTPVKTCHSSDKDCGIVTATKSTTLLALDAAQATVAWWQDGTSGTVVPASSSTSTSTVLLQREDILVQQLSTASGKAVWNVTWGAVQALDFGSSSELSLQQQLLQEYSSTGTGWGEEQQELSLPSIVFGANGRSLTAVWEGHTLWEYDFGQVVASVFGLQQECWKPLHVLGGEADDDDNDTALLLPPPRVSTDVTIFRREPYSIRSFLYSPLHRLSRFFSTFAYQPQPQQHLVVPFQKPYDASWKPTKTTLPYDPHSRLLALPAPPEETGPFLVTWDVVMALIVVVATVLGALFRMLYVRKKSQWMGLLQQLQDRAPPLRRSHSVPTLLTEDDRDAVLWTTSHPNLTGTTNLSITPSTPEPQQGVRFLSDGIPLVKYPRYQSEFTELTSLGKGGFGTVFRCRNALDGRDYAIKKVKWRYDARLSGQAVSQRLQRTLREVKSLALLDHPNIVRYYTAWLELSHGDDEEGGGGSTIHPTDASDGGYLFSVSTSKYPRTAMDRADSLSEGSHHDSHNSSRDAERWKWDANSFLPPPCHEENSRYDDIGFTFERSAAASPQETTPEHAAACGQSKEEVVFEPTCTSQAMDSATRNITSTGKSKALDCGSSTWAGHVDQTGTTTQQDSKSIVWVEHVLFIQMQFCSQKTLADFLSNREARAGTSGSSSDVDIPYALSLFIQIAQGVQHVHSQGLIHRDLKPTNCFMDDLGVVKVGDFGLSRESGDSGEGDAATPVTTTASIQGVESMANGDITAGVGTRSYSSPEQMKGSDYDSSTDIYSLGIMLFELCYPMYTGMERIIVFADLRKHVFPESWCTKTKLAFPSLHALIESMLSDNTADRPTAEIVVQNVRSILEGFTISSLDARHHREDAIVLRVEATPEDDVLQRTMKLLEQAASPKLVEILQYGLKSGPSTATMEFAIACPSESAASVGQRIVTKMQEFPEILLIRQLSNSRYA